MFTKETKPRKTMRELNLLSSFATKRLHNLSLVHFDVFLSVLVICLFLASVTSVFVVLLSHNFLGFCLLSPSLMLWHKLPHILEKYTFSPTVNKLILSIKKLSCSNISFKVWVSFLLWPVSKVYITKLNLLYYLFHIRLLANSFTLTYP